MRRLSTIDCHTAGQPLRLVTGGFPSAPAGSMIRKREHLARHADRLRRILLLEPRGHADMAGALLTEPVSPGSHAGLLFMHAGGFGALCGHGVIAATTIALERGLLLPGGDGVSIVFDVEGGTVRARAQMEGSRVRSVSYAGVPAFVEAPGVSVTVGARHVPADIAFGGEFYAIVDAESAGAGVTRRSLPELRRLGVAIARAVNDTHAIAHPLDASRTGVAGTIFTSPPESTGADLRSVTVYLDGSIDRSPGGAATAAVMAVIDAMGLLGDGVPFVHESLIDTRFTGTIGTRTVVGERAAIVPQIEGRAWITGESTWTVEDDDPLGDGYEL